MATPTEAEMLVNNSARTLSDGYWVCVPEKAVGKHLRATMKEGAKRTVELTDAMAAGCRTGMMIELYSGHCTQVVRLRDYRAAASR